MKQQQQLVTRNEGVAPLLSHSRLVTAPLLPHLEHFMTQLSAIMVGRCSSRILTPLCQTCPLSLTDDDLYPTKVSFESLSISSASSCAAPGGLIGRKHGGRGGTNTFMLLQFVLDIHCQEMR